MSRSELKVRDFSHKGDPLEYHSIQISSMLQPSIGQLQIEQTFCYHICMMIAVSATIELYISHTFTNMIPINVIMKIKIILHD